MNRRSFARLFAAAAALNACPQRARAILPAVYEPRFSVMLWALAREFPFDRCLEIASDAGYQGVELVGEFHRWQPDETHRILAKLQELHLVVDSMSGVEAGFAVPDQSVLFRQQFAEQVRWAVELGCPQIILLSGKRVEGLAPITQRQTAIDNLKRASDLAAEHSLEIVIEPIDLLENPTIFLSSVTDAFSIAREIGRANPKVLYDLYHEQRSYGNLIEKLTQDIDLIGLIHIADVPGRHEPGTGEIHYSAIYRELAKLHYNRFIAMEFYPTHDAVDVLRSAREAAQSAFRS